MSAAVLSPDSALWQISSKTIQTCRRRAGQTCASSRRAAQTKRCEPKSTRSPLASERKPQTDAAYGHYAASRHFGPVQYRAVAISAAPGQQPRGKASNAMTLALVILAIAVFLAGAVLGFLALLIVGIRRGRPRPAPCRRAAHAGGSHHPPGPGRRHPEPPGRQRRRGGLTQCATARPKPSPAIASISTAANAGLASAGTGARRGIPATAVSAAFPERSDLR